MGAAAPGKLTRVGVFWLVVVPLPSWPLPLTPQVYRLPSEPIATEWLQPRIAYFQVNPAGAPWGLLTGIGLLRLVVVPSPSWPLTLLPQM